MCQAPQDKQPPQPGIRMRIVDMTSLVQPQQLGMRLRIVEMTSTASASTVRDEDGDS